MIHISKYFTEQDRIALYDLLRDVKQDKIPILEHLLKEPKKHNFRYGSEALSDTLLIFFHGKCAYCEDFRGNKRNADGKPAWSWQVEHFRPKVIYYWLGYECTNFLISCHDCNSKQCKGEQFPLISSITQLKVDDFIKNGQLEIAHCNIFHDIFKTEQPILINPVIDKPHEFIAFLPDGTVTDKNDRGKESIKIYGLNRPLLIQNRKAIIDEIGKKMNADLRWYKQSFDKQYFIKLLKLHLKNLVAEIKEPTTPFIAFRRTVLWHFDTFVINNNDNITFKKLTFLKRYQKDLWAAYQELRAK